MSAVHGLQNAETGPDGPLGIVFVRHRIAKIDQDTITERVGKRAVKAVNHLGTGLTIGAHDLPQVFRVQVPCQGGKVQQIAAQHGKATAFGLRRGRVTEGGAALTGGGAAASSGATPSV